MMKVTMDETQLLDRLSLVGTGLVLETGYSFGDAFSVDWTEVGEEMSRSRAIKSLYIDYELLTPNPIEYRRMPSWYSGGMRQLLGTNLELINEFGQTTDGQDEVQTVWIQKSQNFVKEAREWLFLWYDNCVGMSYFQGLIPDVPEAGNLRNLYQIHIIGRHVKAQVDTSINPEVSSYELGNYIVQTTWSETPIFGVV